MQFFLRARLPKQLHFWDALHLAADAWDRVSEKTIRNCFRKGGFVLDPTPFDEDADEIVTPTHLSDQEFLEWIAIDQHLPTTREVTDEDVCSKYSENAENTDVSDENGEEGEDDDDFEGKLPTNQEIFSALEVLKKAVHHSATDFELQYKYEQFINNLIIENKKQTKILDFFKKV